MPAVGARRRHARPLVVRAVVDILRAGTPVPSTTSSCRRSISVRSTRAAAIAPEIATGWLTSGQEVAAAAAVAAEHGHAWLNPDRAAALRAPAADIAAAQRAGVRVSVWTVDEPDEIATLADAGIDAIITERSRRRARHARGTRSDERATGRRP